MSSVKIGKMLAVLGLQVKHR